MILYLITNKTPEKKKNKNFFLKFKSMVVQSYIYQYN